MDRSKSKTANPPQKTPGFWVRALLLLALLGFGLWQGWRIQESLKQAQAASLGLADNSGRQAVLRFVSPLGTRGRPFKALLVYQKDYRRLRTKAEALGLVPLTYMGEPSLTPVTLIAPYTHVVFLSGEGVVLASRSCPEGRSLCTITPPLPYSGFLEFPYSPGLRMGETLEVVEYGSWISQ